MIMLFPETILFISPVSWINSVIINSLISQQGIPFLLQSHQIKRIKKKRQEIKRGEVIYEPLGPSLFYFKDSLANLGTQLRNIVLVIIKLVISHQP